MNVIRKETLSVAAALLLCLFVVCCVIKPAEAKVSNSTLSVPVYSQENRSNWCWAASARMISAYSIGNRESTCQFVKWGKGTSICEDVTGSLYEIQGALSMAGVQNTGNVIYSSLSMADVKTQILWFHPMAALWNHPTGLHHIVVIVGHTNDNKVIYNEPRYGTQTSLPYNSFKSHDRYTWAMTLKDL
ncbi:C39 family peptidase [Bifidobacterium amazonense]|uniref:C39 family peptidase n=1 Tax=Bifidobacterium amazonense TaxID=2809027 RepID=A0ABS9VRX8_9BIFI|nr:papain-like cysteine protease family protein [Bifidobacterium amazonense]MCH9274844.1 C39 family peptidase [Bifidobacterium amazonense]